MNRELWLGEVVAVSGDVRRVVVVSVVSPKCKIFAIMDNRKNLRVVVDASIMEKHVLFKNNVKPFIL